MRCVLSGKAVAFVKMSVSRPVGPREKSPLHRADCWPSIQALLQVLIIITGNYNFFNLLTLVLTTALLDDRHLSAEPGLRGHKKMHPCECHPVMTTRLMSSAWYFPRTPFPPPPEPLGCRPSANLRLSIPIAWPKTLLTMLSLLLELTVYGLLAYGTVHYFGLEVDWQQNIIVSKASEYQPGGPSKEKGWISP